MGVKQCYLNLWLEIDKKKISSATGQHSRAEGTYLQEHSAEVVIEKGVEIR